MSLIEPPTLWLPRATLIRQMLSLFLMEASPSR